MADLGKNIKRLRKAYGESQEALASVVNMTKQAIYSYEKNRTEPDTDTLTAIADHFMVSVDVLLNTDIPKIARLFVDPAYVFSQIEVFFPMIESDPLSMNASLKRATMLHNAVFSELKLSDLSHLNLIYECMNEYEKAREDDSCRLCASANYAGMWLMLLISLKLVPEFAKTLPAAFPCDGEREEKDEGGDQVVGDETEAILSQLREQHKDEVFTECLTDIRESGVLSDLGYFYAASTYLWGTIDNGMPMNINRQNGLEMIRSHARIGNPFAKAFLGIRWPEKPKKCKK